MSPFAAALAIVCSSLAADPGFVIRGATIYDGTAGAAVKGDVAIQGDRITGVGKVELTNDARVIDGAGLIVAPGFIDLHSHSDRSITKPETRANWNFVTQGATSILTGNCGSGPVDVGQYLQDVDEHGAGTNVLHLIPQGSLRRKVIGSERRPPSSPELDEMRQLVARGMQEGAWGMSTGLIYTPSSFAGTAELIELAKVVGQYRGLYVSHMRGEGTNLLESIDELLQIGREGNLPVHISHFKASGQPAWGLAAPAIDKVKQARAAGQVVTADQYPYTASSTSLGAMVIPADYRSKSKLFAALEDERDGPRLRDRIIQSINSRGKGKSLYVAGYKTNRQWQGKNLAELAQEQGKSVLEIVLEIQQHGGASMVNFGMSEEEVRLIMQQDFVATASDGSAKEFEDGTQPHPRNYGTFPRKIGHYARAGKVISLAHAIRSASGLPADILGLPERGYVKPGHFADLVVLDPDSFIDTATFNKPHQYATGVRFLFVNGQLVIDNGKRTDLLPGRAIRHPSGKQQ